jgi:hypothetical protein
MPALRLALSPALVAVAVTACSSPRVGGGTVPPPKDPGDIKGPGPLDPLDAPPNLPGYAYFDLDCKRDASMNEWSSPEYDMHVGVRVESCDIYPDGNNTVIRMGNPTNPHESVTLQLPAIRNQASVEYRLDQPRSSSTPHYIEVADSLTLPTWKGPYNESGSWTGPSNTGGHSAEAPDSCGAPGCFLQVDDPDPSAPYPKRLEFRVRCRALCVNGTQLGGNNGVMCYADGHDATNPGAIEVSFPGTCTRH